MNSPHRVPPSRRPSTQGQLLDELEALSQALYQAQAQQKTFGDQQGHAQPLGQDKDTSPAFTKKPLARRETLPARRFSSYEPSKDASAVPLPGLAATLSAPVPSAHPGSRHSISTPQIPTTVGTKPSPVLASRPRFTSTTLPSQTLTSWGDEKSDIRSRNDRRRSPQLQHTRSSEQFGAEEVDWPDDAPDVISKLEPSPGDKKKSFWNWKPLRAISHIGRQRFYCVFSAYVHSVKGLPPAMNGLRLAVHIRKEESKEGAVQTIPSRVFQGVAEFEETLYMKCTVYGSKGSHSNSIKFMSKSFIVSVVAPDVEELDLGKHQLDLSRLLPETVDERKGDLERGSSWSTSLELTGKAKGGKLAITFNYEVLDKDLAKSSGLASKFQGGSTRRRSSMQTSYSLPNSAHGTPRTKTAIPYGNVSPSVSEPGNDFSGDLGMEVLDLDDPLEGAGEVKAPPQPEVQYYASINSQLGMPAGSSLDAYNAFDNFEPRLKDASQEMEPSTPGHTERDKSAELDDYASDNEPEFTVVDQGMEIDDAVQVFRREEEVRLEPECEHPKVLQEDVKVESDSQEDVKVESEKSSQSDLIQEKISVHEEANSIIGSQDAGEKKETVTYQMVMKTLESLLQGTSAKERAHSEFLEGQDKLQLSKSDREALSKQVKEAAMQVRSKQGGSVDTNESKGRKVEGKQQAGEENLDQEVDEFLHMLESGDNVLGQNSDSEPDSPRAQLLKQFEQEAFLEGGFGLDLSPSKDPDNSAAGASAHTLSSAVGKPAAMSSLSKSTLGGREPKPFVAAQSFQSKTKDGKAKSSGEAEQEQGWKEKALPITTPKQLEPEPLGKGLGASVTVKDGGTLRSMNPALFQSENCSGKLVMQVSKPVVLPAEMGSGTVDVLRNMASMGIENMALQAMTAMPLDELMGTSIEQIAMEGMAAGKASRIRGAFGAFRLRPTVKETPKTSQQLSDNKDAYVSLESLAPMAMPQLEFLAMDGLKIQAGMTEEEAPYALNAFSMEGQGGGDDASRWGNTGSLRGVTGVHLLKGAKVPAQTAGGGKGLMDMAITLDEWMLLDGGSYTDSENSRDALAIMVAHRAVQDADRKMPDPKSKGPPWGCMGNMLSIAMLVQLRDPLRSYEPIGVPMIAFVQAERVVLPILPKTVVAENQSESLFKITGVHMAGVKASQDNRRPGWGSQRQLRAATRWLLAHGMSKPKGTATSRTKVRQGDCLWSISAQLLGSGNKWKDLMKRNPHVRNPDVLYETHGVVLK